MNRGIRGRGRGRGSRGGGRGAKSLTAVWKQPLEVANELDEGEIRPGEDGTSQWKVVVLRATGNHRWYRTFPKPFATKAGHPPAETNNNSAEEGNDQPTPFVLGKSTRGRGRGSNRGGGGTRLPDSKQMTEKEAYDMASDMASDIIGGNGATLFKPKPSTDHWGPPINLPTGPLSNTTPTRGRGGGGGRGRGKPIQSAPSAKVAASTISNGMEIEDSSQNESQKMAGQIKNVGFKWTNYNDPSNIFLSSLAAPSTTAKTCEKYGGIGFVNVLPRQVPTVGNRDDLMSD